MTRFVDSFWDTEFNSTNGYDVLLKRMKDGREMCKDYEEFLKQRAKAEDTYGKTLMRIAKNSGGKEEIGSLKTAWSEVVSKTEVCGVSHTEISSRLMDEAKKVEEFRETQKERRRKSEEAIKKLIVAKKDQSHKVMGSKKTYENRCKEYDQAEDAFMKGRLVLPAKDQERMTVKRDKAKQAATVADQQYQKDVTTLEQTRQQWEEQMTQLCVIFQQMEMERICFLRNAMWVFANIMSLQCCNDDTNSEEMRKSLSDCSEEKDIQLFISQKSTGSTGPAPIVYECYYKDGMVAKASGGITNGRNRQTLPPIPGNPKVNQSRALPQPPPMSPQPPPMSPHGADGIYSSMSEYSTGVIGGAKTDRGSTSNKFMAKFDYEAQGEEELSVKAGDIVTIIDQEDSIWWYAQLNANKGHVPAEYLTSYTDTGEEGSISFL